MSINKPWTLANALSESSTRARRSPKTLIEAAAHAGSRNSRNRRVKNVDSEDELLQLLFYWSRTSNKKRALATQSFCVLFTSNWLRPARARQASLLFKTKRRRWITSQKAGNESRSRQDISRLDDRVSRSPVDLFNSTSNIH